MNTRFIVLWVTRILHLPVCVFASSQFYQALHQAVTEDEVLKTLSNVNTITECVLQCWTHDQCLDVAIQDGGICLLLRQSSEKDNKQLMQNITRVIPLKEQDG